MTEEPSGQACPCQEGMFPLPGTSRRNLIFAAGSSLAALPLLSRTASAEMAAAPPGAAHYDVPPDPTKEQGRAAGEDGGYGTRSQFETAVREHPVGNAYTVSTRTPLADVVGNVTPSGLHYERHHNGIPTIDPAHHSLVVHGLVKTPKRFTMADIKRMPAVGRRHFIECSGNTASDG